MRGALVGKDKSSSRASTLKGAGPFQMPRGGFRLLEGEDRGQVVRVLGIGDRYTICRQTRAVEKGKDVGGVGTEGGRKKRAKYIAGGLRVLGGTRRMG